MPMNYKGLFHYLIDEDIKESDLKKRANISAPTLSKLKKGETVTTEIIGRICNALGCEPNNIMEYDREFEIGQIYDGYIDDCDHVVIIKILTERKNYFGVFPLYAYTNTSLPHVILKAKDTNLSKDYMLKCDHLYKTTIDNSEKYYATLSKEHFSKIIDCIKAQKALSEELGNLIKSTDTNN